MIQNKCRMREWEATARPKSHRAKTKSGGPGRGEGKASEAREEGENKPRKRSQKQWRGSFCSQMGGETTDLGLCSCPEPPGERDVVGCKRRRREGKGSGGIFPWIPGSVQGHPGLVGGASALMAGG